MDEIDLTGLVLVTLVGAFLSAFGRGIDSLLLDRHVVWFDHLALRWWNFLDDLKIANLPRIAISSFLSMKERIFGKGFGLSFLFRAGLTSVVLTALIVPTGKIGAGLYLAACTAASDPNYKAFQTVDDFLNTTIYSHPWESLWLLVAINVFFDVLTLAVTAYLLRFSQRLAFSFPPLIIAIDVVICLVFVESIFSTVDVLGNVNFPILPLSFGSQIEQTMLQFQPLHCATSFVVLPRLIFTGTVVIPTLAYLMMIFGLFVGFVSFQIVRWFTLHILEKSVEGQKTFFAHVGLSIGILAAGIKFTVEILKLV